MDKHLSWRFGVRARPTHGAWVAVAAATVWPKSVDAAGNAVLASLQRDAQHLMDALESILDDIGEAGGDCAKEVVDVRVLGDGEEDAENGADALCDANVAPHGFSGPKG